MTTSDKCPSSRKQMEFLEVIGALSASTDDDTQHEITQDIWDRFGTAGTVFISDMANFSSTSRQHGICHFLKMIHRAREIIGAIVTRNGGLLIKSEADNCYAFFSQVDDAIRSSFEINAELFRINQSRPADEHIYLSVGIDYGDMLLIGDAEFFGDPVNTASKLGEDLAIKGETLVTARALERSTFAVNENAEHMIARLSDIEISYLRIPMTEACV